VEDVLNAGVGVGGTLESNNARLQWQWQLELDLPPDLLVWPSRGVHAPLPHGHGRHAACCTLHETRLGSFRIN